MVNVMLYLVLLLGPMLMVTGFVLVRFKIGDIRVVLWLPEG